MFIQFLSNANVSRHSLEIPHFHMVQYIHTEFLCEEVNSPDDVTMATTVSRVTKCEIIATSCT
jgi:hypothetical protein